MEIVKGCNNLKNVAQINSNLSNTKQINSKIQGFVEVPITYSGENTDSIEINVNNKDKIISAEIVQTQYNSRLEFPSVGSSKLIYIDLSENSLWRFDEKKLQYICVGRDYTEIEAINGGNA